MYVNWSAQCRHRAGTQMLLIISCYYWNWRLGCIWPWVLVGKRRSKLTGILGNLPRQRWAHICRQVGRRSKAGVEMEGVRGRGDVKGAESLRGRRGACGLKNSG